jgi:hypothetical protein
MNDLRSTRKNKPNQQFDFCLLMLKLNRLYVGKIPDVWNVNVSNLRTEAANISETPETLPKSTRCKYSRE